MKFKAKRGAYIKSLVAIFFLAPALVLYFLPEVMSEHPVIAIILFVPLLNFLWIYFDTSYTIDDGRLFYRSGFVRGNILISNIQKVIKGKTPWTGTRPATAFKGLLIISDRGDEVYVSPEENDALLNEMLVRNDRIIVVG